MAEYQEFELKAFLKKNSLKIIDGSATTETGKKLGENDGFNELVKFVDVQLRKSEEKELKEEKALMRQRNALLGNLNAVEFYKNKIREILDENDLRREKYPSYYPSLEEAIYQELHGFLGVYEWLNDDKYNDSDSAMVIGDRIFFECDGYLRLQPQRLPATKRNRLKDTLMLTNPRENRAAAKHELYSGGKRVTIFDEGYTKEGEDVIIFRKYHVNVYNFKQQADKGTIPYEAIPLFESMVGIGYNVAFTGPVKTAKTTFLATWQSHENPELTGLCIETDPEIPLHKLMPTAPIIQFVPYPENMDDVIDRAKRSDAKYVIVAEARNGKMLNIVIEAANMGTFRSKVTFHNSATVDFCYDVAEKITREVGGNIIAYMVKAAKTFQYVFNFYALPGEEGKKRLKGIWEVRLNEDTFEIEMIQICKYVRDTDSWVWAYDIGVDKINLAKDLDVKGYPNLNNFKDTLAELSAKYPNNEKYKFKDPYLRFLTGGKSYD